MKEIQEEELCLTKKELENLKKELKEITDNSSKPIPGLNGDELLVKNTTGLHSYIINLSTGKIHIIM